MHTHTHARHIYVYLWNICVAEKSTQLSSLSCGGSCHVVAHSFASPLWVPAAILFRPTVANAKGISSPRFSPQRRGSPRPSARPTHSLACRPCPGLPARPYANRCPRPTPTQVGGAWPRPAPPGAVWHAAVHPAARIGGVLRAQPQHIEARLDFKARQRPTPTREREGVWGWTNQ